MTIGITMATNAQTVIQHLSRRDDLFLTTAYKNERRLPIGQNASSECQRLCIIVSLTSPKPSQTVTTSLFYHSVLRKATPFESMHISASIDMLH